MSNDSTYSLKSRRNEMRDTIPCRIEFIQDLLRGKNLEPLVNFDNTDTEFFISKDENESGQSYDTAVVLKKRHLNFAETIGQIGGKLQYIKSGTTGHTFKGEIKEGNDTLEYAVKVVAYPKKERYGNINDTRRPENAELMMIKKLSHFIIKKRTPHIVLPIGTFNTDITTFVDLITSNVVSKDNEKYAEFITRYKKGEYHKHVSILISEWANRGDLLDFIRKYHDDFTPTHWKAIFFQVLSVLAVIQSIYPAFRHNDMKANNILVHKITKQSEFFTYKVSRCEYRVPNIGYQIKLWDFDFACIPGIVDNKKVESEWTKTINVTPEENKYYDVHYFFNTLIKRGFCPEIMTSEKVPQELKDFINRVVPKKYQKTGTDLVGKRGRILVNDQYLTADDILKFDPYFAEYRSKKMANGTVQYANQAQKGGTIKKSFTKDAPVKPSTKKDTVKTINPVNIPAVNGKTEPKPDKSKVAHKQNIPDLTKFLKSDSNKTSNESSYDVPQKKIKPSTKPPTKTSIKPSAKTAVKKVSNDGLNEIIKGAQSKQKTKPKSTKKPKKTKGDKIRSRTISEEIRELDPDVLLKYTTSN